MGLGEGSNVVLGALACSVICTRGEGRVCNVREGYIGPVEPLVSLKLPVLIGWRVAKTWTS